MYVDYRHLLRKKSHKSNSESEKVVLYSIRQSVSKHPPDSNVARAAFYLGRKFGERAERKRKLTLRDETRRKREKEKKKRSEGMKTERARDLYTAPAVPRLKYQHTAAKFIFSLYLYSFSLSFSLSLFHFLRLKLPVLHRMRRRHQHRYHQPTSR